MSDEKEADEPEVMNELRELEKQIRAYMEKLEAGGGGSNGPAPAKLRRLQITGAASVLLAAALAKLTRDERSGLLSSLLAYDTISSLFGKAKTGKP
jgi:hypothetical protein